ncbi:hypothetical protein ACHWQZ_G015700 [Mnemiopsis leidyi]
MAVFVDGQHRTDYGRIVLTTDNVLHSAERVQNTPSRADGINYEDERDIKIIGCELIQASGLLLQLPQVAMATAQILFHRFYLVKSLVIHNYEHQAMAAIFLAAKIEEHPRRIRDVINCFHHIKQVKEKKTPSPLDFTGTLYVKQKNDVIKAERRLLKELGFCVHVKYPHKIIIVILSLMLEQSQNTELVQLAWNFMNDSLRSDVFMRYAPDQIGCACIWLSARIKKICLPENPPWYELLDCSREQCEEISRTILNFYCIPRPNAEKLERVVNAAKEAYELKKSFNEKSKRELKEIKKQESASNFSPLDPNRNKDSPHKPKLSPGSLINNKLSKLAENGSSESHKNGGVRRSKHHSPRRRYSPVSPPRRKHDRYSRKKRRSSSDSESSSVVRKRKHRSKRRVSSSSDDSSSSSDSEAAREEARKRKHEEKKKLADAKKLQEKIKLLEKEKERSKKEKHEKILRDPGKEHRHKVR